MDIELHLMRAFVVVAETGGVTRAAELLHCTQPTVSGQLKTLEARLGVALFVRGGQGMALTDEGRRLLGPAKRWVDEADALASLAGSLQGGVAGTLRVGLNSPPDWFQPTPLWVALSERYPHLTLEFEQSSSGEIMQGLRDGRLDVGFFEGPPHRALEVHRLFRIGMCVVIPPAWADDSADAPIERLRDRPWIFTSPSCSYHRLFESIWKPDGPPEQLRYRIDHDRRAIVDLVESGMAASIMDRRMAEEAAAQGRVVIHRGFSARHDLQVGALRSRIEEPAVAAFLALCRESEPATFTLAELSTL